MTRDREWDGYTPRAVVKDGERVDAQYAALWPAGTPGVDAAAPGHEAKPKTTLVYDDKTPPGKKKKRKAKPVPGGGK